MPYGPGPGVPVPVNWFRTNDIVVAFAGDPAKARRAMMAIATSPFNFFTAFIKVTPVVFGPKIRPTTLPYTETGVACQLVVLGGLCCMTWITAGDNKTLGSVHLRGAPHTTA